MARYIDVDKLLNNLPNDLPYKASVKRVIMQAPTADVAEVKHGEWIGLECSKCGHFATYANDYNYCPRCGAKMDGTPKIKRWGEVNIPFWAGFISGITSGILIGVTIRR